MQKTLGLYFTQTYTTERLVWLRSILQEIPVENIVIRVFWIEKVAVL